MLSIWPLAASASDQKTKLTDLQLHWQSPISKEWDLPHPLPEKILRINKDELIAVGRAVVPLSRRGSDASILLTTESIVIDAALDPQGNISIGGRSNQFAFVSGGDMANAYLRKFSQNGQKLAEFKFGGLSWRQIISLHPLNDGGVIVSGPKGGSTWLASISDRGRIRWEKFIGVGRESAVTEGRDKNIAYVGLRKEPTANGKFDLDVVFLLFDAKGNVLADRVIRRSINPYNGETYESLAIESAEDGYFALVGWRDPSSSKALRAVKLSLAGMVQWDVQLDHTAILREGRGVATWNKCDQKQTVLPKGELMVTCSVGDELIISRLDSVSGNEKIQKVKLPACHNSRPAIITPVVSTETTVFLLGSRPCNDVSASCNWFAEWSLQ